MSDTAQGPGWWVASDGKWYPPEQHPDAQVAQPPPVEQPSMEQPSADQVPTQEPYMEQPSYMEQPTMAQTDAPPAGQPFEDAQQSTGPPPGGWDSSAGAFPGAAPSYSPSPYASAPVGYAGAGMRQIGKTRSPIVTWLLSIITFDIYFLVWYYKINKEAQAYDSSIEVNPAIAVLAIFPGGLILIPELVSIFKTGERMKRLQQSSRAQPSASGILFLVLMLIFGVGIIYLQSEINKAWASAQR
jgi:hypothetical protein